MTDQRKILVVEDDPDILRILTQTLGSAGYQVVQAYGGEDALRKVKLHPPDLVLTDLAMPVMSGVELIHQLKKDPATHDIPVVAVTAFVWDGIARSAAEVGCDGFLAKPFKSADLLREVARHFSGEHKEPTVEKPVSRLRLQR
jgi:CheY-like chemotaxis protein